MKTNNEYKRLNDNYSLVTDAYEHNMGSVYLSVKKIETMFIFSITDKY